MPVCASCGHERAEDANFCPKCGAPYEAAEALREALDCYERKRAPFPAQRVRERLAALQPA